MISVKVEVSPGASLEDTCADMRALAEKIDCTVEANFNGVDIVVNRDTLPSQAVANYYRAVQLADGFITPHDSKKGA